MKNEHKRIIELLSLYLEQNPRIRFGQALFNLGINEIHPNTTINTPSYLRDTFHDSDKEILDRIKIDKII